MIKWLRAMWVCFRECRLKLRKERLQTLLGVYGQVAGERSLEGLRRDINFLAETLNLDRPDSMFHFLDPNTSPFKKKN